MGKRILGMAVLAMLAAQFSLPAEAKSGHATRAPATKFRTSTCKTDACKSKHPSGSWVHPITPKKHS